MNRVIIGLGSNIEPEINIPKVCKILAQHYRIIAESTCTTTKSIGTIQQADFVNGTVLLETELTCGQLTEALKEIESDLGRSKGHDQCSPRTIDLDIVVWDENIVDQDFYDRDYLKRSVLELVPDLKYDQ